MGKVYKLSRIRKDFIEISKLLMQWIPLLLTVPFTGFIIYSWIETERRDEWNRQRIPF